MTAEIRFEWDDRKDELNRRKHGVRFELASLVFDDPHVYYIEGDEYGEIRWRAIGQIDGRLIFVSYTSFQEGEAEIIRIISARRATRQERRTYERNAEIDR
jgi:uncharacterized DUF497 family protein